MIETKYERYNIDARKDEKGGVTMTNCVSIKETNSAQNENFDFFVTECDMLCDIKAILKDYYVATFTADESALIIGFTNGQKFRVNVTTVA